MLNPNLLLNATTLAGTNALAPEALATQGAPGPWGIPQIPKGTVETTHGPTTERKIVGDETRGALDSMDEAQQRRINAMDEQSKSSILNEQAAAEAAAKQQKAAEEIEAKREELRRAEQERMAQEVSRRAQALDELEKASKVSSLYEDASPLRKFVSAIAIGFGAYASSMNGGPNQAWEIFKSKEDDYRKRQEAAIKKATDKVMLQTKSAEEARKYFDLSMEDLDKRQAAKLKIADLQLAAVQKANPEAAARAEEARSKVQIEYHDQKAKFLQGYDTTVKHEGTSTQTSSGDKSGTSARAPTSNDMQNFAIMKEHGQMAARIKELIKQGHVPTPEMEREYEQNENLLLNRIAKEEEHGKPSVLWSGFLRTVGAQPENSYPEDADKLQREYLDLRRGLKHFTAFKFGGQTGAASSGSRHTFAGPRWGEAGESIEDATRKDMESASAIEDAWKEATEATKAGERIAKVESRAQQNTPHHPRGIPAAKQDAAISTADLYGEIHDAITSGKMSLSKSEQADMKDVLSTLKADPTNVDAARFLEQLKKRKGL